MSKSVADVNKERKAKYGTAKNQFSDFPIGSAVKVICVCQDMTFFSGEETGIVVKNSGDYLGIIVKFDKEYPRPDFNFAPDDLVLLSKPNFTPELVLNLIEQSKDKSLPLTWLTGEIKKL